MRNLFLIVVAMALIVGIFGLITWEPSMGGFNRTTTALMSAVAGGLLGLIIAFVVEALRKIIYG